MNNDYAYIVVAILHINDVIDRLRWVVFVGNNTQSNKGRTKITQKTNRNK